MRRLPTLVVAVLLALVQGVTGGVAYASRASKCATRPCCRPKAATTAGPTLHAERPCCRPGAVTPTGAPATLGEEPARLSWIAALVLAPIHAPELGVTEIAIGRERVKHRSPTGIGRGLPYRLQV